MSGISMSLYNCMALAENRAICEAEEKEKKYNDVQVRLSKGGKIEAVEIFNGKFNDLYCTELGMKNDDLCQLGIALNRDIRFKKPNEMKLAEIRRARLYRRAKRMIIHIIRRERRYHLEFFNEIKDPKRALKDSFVRVFLKKEKTPEKILEITQDGKWFRLPGSKSVLTDSRQAKKLCALVSKMEKRVQEQKDVSK